MKNLLWSVPVEAVPALVRKSLAVKNRCVLAPVLHPQKLLSVNERKGKGALKKKKEKKTTPPKTKPKTNNTFKIKFMLLNPFSSSVFNLVWQFTKSLRNFWKAMLNITSKILETITHGSVGSRQKWCHACLFTFQDLLSPLASLIFIYLFYLSYWPVQLKTFTPLSFQMHGSAANHTL